MVARNGAQLSAPLPVPRRAHPWVLTVRGGAIAREIPLQEGTVSLGCSRLCGIVLEGRDVAGQHARLQVSRAGAVLSILPHAAPALLNGVRVQRAGLSSGDSFRLGDLQLTVRRCAEAEPTPAPSLREPPGDGHAAARAQADDLDWLEGVLVWSLRGPAGERPAMLARVCRALGAEAACLFTADAGGHVASVVAAWGDALGGLEGDELARLVRRVAGEEGSAVAAAGDTLVAGVSGLPGGAFVLAVRGAVAGEAIGPLRLALRLFAHEALREQASGLRTTGPAPSGLRFPTGVVVGHSAAARRLYDQLEAVAEGHLPVLVLGETGVGKEHVAQLIHDSSRRGDRPFVTINCAAIPAELLEAELFGIGRGVATGVVERAGKFREAHGGTLLLDEVGELPLPLQAKLLRALEEKKVQPVGGQAAAVDLRIVAATNSRLEEAAKAGGFRLDLYYRLAGFVVEVPPLRERREDIPLLFEAFLREVVSPPPRLAPQALAALVRHCWPGNVRELRHEAARVAAQVGAGGVVELEDLSSAVAAAAPAAERAEELEGGRAAGNLDGELARLERALIREALGEAAGNLSAAARRLGVSRTRLYRRLAELG
jgi:DNA-binding NtrC family response regulator